MAGALTLSAGVAMALTLITCPAGSTSKHPCLGTKGDDQIDGTSGPDVIDSLDGLDYVSAGTATIPSTAGASKAATPLPTTTKSTATAARLMSPRRATTSSTAAPATTTWSATAARTCLAGAEAQITSRLAAHRQKRAWISSRAAAATT